MIKDRDADLPEVVQWEGKFITAKTRGRWEYVGRARGIKAAAIIAVDEDPDGTRRLWVTSDSGLVWSMNCDSCDEPKNSRTAATAGLALIRSFGITVDTSTELIRSLTARSMRRRPTRYWFSSSSPTERTRRLPRLSMSSISPLPSLRFTSSLTTARMSSVRSVVIVSSASRPKRMLSLTRPTADKS